MRSPPSRTLVLLGLAALTPSVVSCGSRGAAPPAPASGVRPAPPAGGGSLEHIHEAAHDENSPGGVVTLPVLMRFDGSSLSQIPLPPIDRFREIDLAEDGTLVALGSVSTDPGERVVWALPSGGEWMSIRMPVIPTTRDVYQPWSIAAHSLRDIWVVGYQRTEDGKDRGYALFHDRPTAGTVTAPQLPR